MRRAFGQCLLANLEYPNGKQITCWGLPTEIHDSFDIFQKPRQRFSVSFAKLLKHKCRELQSDNSLGAVLTITRKRNNFLAKDPREFDHKVLGNMIDFLPFKNIEYLH